MKEHANRNVNGPVARERRRGDRPPSMGMDIYLVNMERQGILCLLAVKNGMGVAT